jgi:hypothetical protein
MHLPGPPASGSPRGGDIECLVRRLRESRTWTDAGTGRDRKLPVNGWSHTDAGALLRVFPDRDVCSGPHTEGLGCHSLGASRAVA